MAERQRTYRWNDTSPEDDYYGLPGYIAGGWDVDNLPRELRFTLDEKKMERIWREYTKNASSSQFAFYLLIIKKKTDKIVNYFFVLNLGM